MNPHFYKHKTGGSRYLKVETIFCDIIKTIPADFTFLDFIPYYTELNNKCQGVSLLTYSQLKAQINNCDLLSMKVPNGKSTS